MLTVGGELFKKIDDIEGTTSSFKDCILIHVGLK